jgi:hypothetical protein
VSGVVLRARPLVIGRIGPCGAIHWHGAMHLVHADSREEAWRYTSPVTAILQQLHGETWDGAARSARAVVKAGFDIVRRQRPDVDVIADPTRPASGGGGEP